MYYQSNRFIYHVSFCVLWTSWLLWCILSDLPSHKSILLWLFNRGLSESCMYQFWGWQLKTVLTHFTNNTAVPWQKDQTDIAPLCLFQLHHLHINHEIEWHRQQMIIVLFVLYHDWSTFNAGHLYWTFNLLCNHPLCKWYS